MPQIKNVTVAPAGPVKNCLGTSSHVTAVGEKHNRVKVSLDRSTPHLLPALIERNAPVEADYLRTGLLHRAKQARSGGAEVDHRGACPLQFPDQLSGSRQYIAPIVFHRQTAYPTVEDLDHV